MTQEDTYARESWFGDSRDGQLENASGYHFFRMKDSQFIVEAYEYYEHDDGTEVATPLPEMTNISYLSDLGFDDLDSLDMISKTEFEQVKAIVSKNSTNR